jgi:hypothetical protein
MTAVIAIRETAAGRFEARYQGEVIATSSSPLCAGARVLLDRGVPPDTELVMRRAGSPVDALISTVGAAARLSVSDSRHGTPVLRPWRPSRGVVSGLPVAGTDSLANQMPLAA